MDLSIRHPWASVPSNEARRYSWCAPTGGDPEPHRTFLIVSRQPLIDAAYSTVIRAPVFTDGDALSTQVRVGPKQGLKHASWVACDNPGSIRKSELTQFLGSLSWPKLAEALRVALALD
jgi:mRNA-degrading endonuclease toxin of MazEF toxin-antitoxin module